MNKKSTIRIIEDKYLPYFILLFGVSISFWAYQLSTDALKKRYLTIFNERSMLAAQTLHNRVNDYLQILKGVQAFMNVKKDVSRDDWKQYVSRLQVSNNYPGIQGIGFAEYITKKELKSHITEIRSEGFNDYKVFPEGERDIYTPIRYIEPFSGTNLKAFGYDMFSEYNRRMAMQLARDKTIPVVSAKVTLVQESDSNKVQSGFLLYLPVYYTNVVQSTLVTKHELTKGFIYSPFRMNDLMGSVLGKRFEDINLEIYDGLEPTKFNLLYSNHNDHFSQYSKKIIITLPGRKWVIVASPNTSLISLSEAWQPYLILFGGTLISILLFVAVFFLSNTKKSAERMAEEISIKYKENQEQFLALAETANDAIITTDIHYHIIFINKIGCELLGISQAQSKRIFLRDFLPEIVLADNSERFVLQETHVRNSEGRIFPVEYSLASWVTTKGRFSTLILRDITERKRTEEIIKSKNIELERSNKELENFASIASHDLQEPLRTITSYLQLLQSRFKSSLDETGNEFIDIVTDGAIRMKTLINNLLDYSRINKSDENHEPVDFNVLVSDILQSIEKSLQETECRINVSELPTVKGNYYLFYQLFLNLINNSIKFRSHTRDPIINISVIKENKLYRFTVSDNGIGIDNKYEDRIFKIFQRLHGREDYEGTGIGLAICKKIVEKYGGEIWFESKEGEGTTFYFTLMA